ncbi:HD domain-containing protein [Peptostreptococcus porci]|uniref:HD domain-containing protein n=1 Tax=Peptostreptococcus porci TaxID=2652282 RepID=UPI002A7FFCA5|nr:HD domain-containing protein [Peptostreptococcus porci]
MEKVVDMNKDFIFPKDYCPTKYECMDILNRYQTPEHVQLHCFAVGEAAKSIAIELNKKGLKINSQLVAAAGYLHDIARVHKNHEKVGAEYLYSIGLENVAKVINDHTKHKINTDIFSLDEEDVLCIADRVVLQSNFVGPQRRMDYIKSNALKKYGQESEDFLDSIIEKFVRFIAELEEFIGDELYNIIPDEIK